MRGTVSACVLAIVILALGHGGSAEKPKITPSGDFTVQVGGNFVISCQSRGEVTFSTQNLTGKATHSSYETSSDIKAGVHKFQFNNAKAADTGWYACAEEGVEIRNDEQTTEHPDDNISWTYVFVKSTEPFAVTNAQETISVVAGRSVVIPCRPTSPDSEVRLNILDPPNTSPPEYVYDPRIGFIIRQAKLTYDGSLFSCRVDRTKEGISPRYTLNVKVPEKPEKPKITQGTLFHAILGENLVFDCQTDAPKGDDITLYWKMPSAAEGSTSTLQNRMTNQTEHEVVSDDRGPRVVWKSKLTVRKTERSDRGDYFCVAKGFVDSSSSSMEIQIWEPGNITGGKVTRVSLSQPAVLSCSVNGYSLSNFTWANINTPESGERSKTTKSHFVSPTASEVMYLNFTSVTRGDNGTYECRATDYNGTLSSQTSLIVTEVPEVTIDSATSKGNDTVFLHWTLYDGNEPVTAYHIEQRKHGMEQWENCSGKINKTLRNYVAEKLENNTEYEFRITAENAIGRSNTSYSESIRTLEQDVNTKFVSEVVVERISNTEIKVFWTPPEVIRDQFHYYQLLAKYENDIRKAINLPLNVTTHVFHDLRSKAEYVVEVQACSIYTGKCVTSSPKTRGIGLTIAMYLGFILAFLMFVVMGIWIYKRKQRERDWERDCRLADLNSTMF